MNRDTNKNLERLPAGSQMSGGVKITRSFRLSPEAIELVQRAAEESGAAQGDIIEGCVLEAIKDVSARLASDRQKKEEQRAAALAKVKANTRPPGRPRRETPAQARRLPKDHVS